MNNIIEIKNVTKTYKNKKALDNLSLEVSEGKILGILGPNGSGKTTLIKLITGLTRPNSGEVKIDGEEPGVYTKSIISYLPDRNYLDSWMSIKDVEKVFEDFYKDFDKSKFRNLLEFMDLNIDLKVDELSKGMLEKLNLSLVLGRNAKVYILDEPIAGVDPVARDKILEAIVKNYSEESTMIITTHLVKDMEMIFEDVLFLKDGQVDLYENAEILREKYNLQIDDIYKEIFR